MNISSVVRKIKLLEVQGAEHIGLLAVESFLSECFEHSKTPSFTKHMFGIRRLLESSRPTEPFLQNAFRFIFQGISFSTPSITAFSSLVIHSREFLNFVHQHHEQYILFASKKICSNGVILTHCHSSSVVDSLVFAWNSKKRFNVRNTETRPLFQGRITASQLAKNNIPVTHFVDSGFNHALDGADIVLLGCDAITHDGVVNKIGSGVLAELSRLRDIPLYIVTDSLKVDLFHSWSNELVEHRSGDEVWSNAPAKIKIHNPAFELIPKLDITGIVSEFGILSHDAFMEEVIRRYPWLVKK